MDPSRRVISLMLPQAVPVAQEVALIYAAGRPEQAAARLAQALEPGRAEAGNRELWCLLFDLHRIQGAWESFDQLARRYETAFADAAPSWLSEADLTSLPVELRNSNATHFVLSGMLDTAAVTQFDIASAPARERFALHVDFSRVNDVETSGCAALQTALRRACDEGNAVLLTGAEHLEAKLRCAIEHEDAAAACWTLLLELHRLRDWREEFERTALEFALSTGAAPPLWEPLLTPLASVRTVQEKRDEPRYGSGPEVFALSGVMLGSLDEQLLEAERFGAQRGYVNLNLARLARMDLACARAFVQLLNDLSAVGRTVRLIHPNALVATLLASLELSSSIILLRTDSMP